MQIVFKQNKRYGCSFYTLANLFNDARYLDYIEEDQGGFVEHMNRAIREILPEHFLTCIFCVHSGLPVQNRFFDVLLLQMNYEEMAAEVLEDGFRPIIASVKMASGVHHAILIVQRFKNNKFYVFNSLMQLAQEFTEEELVLNYWITELHIFETEEIRKLCTYGSKDWNFCYWNYKQMPHLKPES